MVFMEFELNQLQILARALSENMQLLSVSASGLRMFPRNHLSTWCWI
jgi:hypothetical protein